MPAPAVFLDRDDTLIRCDDVTPDGDLGDPNLVEPLPGAVDACRRLKDAGLTLVVVTNQGGVARGRYSTSTVDAVNARVNDVFGGVFDAFRFCPYHPKGTVPEFTREHPWRKPAPGMLFDAADALGIDLGASWMIGDRVRDCTAGRAAGCRGTILVTVPGRTEAPNADVDLVAHTITDAAGAILAARP
jgi:D-glycero-D-manno-heptose 1,7-bisphosphate phosphatase